jgi:AhpD family alkylhydroperoxidase
VAARLPYVERDQVPAEVQATYDRVAKRGGRGLNFYRLMAHHARSVPPFDEWYAVLREGDLDPKLRQLAYVRASQLNRCRYCATHHSALGQRVGVSREQLEALPDFETSLLFSELERLVLRYAEQMTVRVQVDGTLVQALRGHLSPEALVQLTLSIAGANFTNRVQRGAGDRAGGSGVSQRTADLTENIIRLHMAGECGRYASTKLVTKLSHSC